MVEMIRSDLEFILDGILISEAHANGTPLTSLIASPVLPFGMRTVDGSFNNLVPGQSEFGAADNPFPHLSHNHVRPGYGITAPNQLVTDGSVRDISNLIVDISTRNPAAVEAAGIDYDPNTAAIDFNLALGADGLAGTADDNIHIEELVITNVAPDEGLSAGFNSWFTLFGQFFDHGLDLVSKGGNGTIFMPLDADDPLVAGADHVFGTADDLPEQLRFMVLSRATNLPGPDGQLGTADDIQEHVNTTTSFVDQNQTYTSHASHQVFLREYALNGAGDPVATGRMADGANGGIANWAEIKAQAADLLGIQLTDADIFNVPQLVTDEYGRFIRGANGYPQIMLQGGGVVEGDPGANGGLGVLVPVNAVRTGHAFLDDIAHNAVPRNSQTGVLLAPDADGDVNDPNVPRPAGTYDDELLNEHFITGDGRGNENIGLTAVHTIFHAEHNRLVDHIKEVILDTGDPAFIAQWQISPGVWNGERLFQAARFGTEMQYQHLVFEEFARKIAPMVDIFVAPVGYQADIDPSIVAEFAHTVYRFGHSMLRDTIDQFDPTFNPKHQGLIESFLNPIAFDENGTLTAEQAAGEIVRGMTRQAGSQIDEFVTGAVRNNLLGLPLDLASINLARGRDAGVPPLNAARRDFFAQTGDSQLAPYESWTDFAGHLRNETSIINFIAAYGTHDLITSQTTLEGKRNAALTLITGTSFGGLAVPADAVDFLNATGDWAGGTLGGLENVDLWIGGLAEANMPFGAMLGSTFLYVFETQLESLQNGDRFYYLARTDGLHFLSELENNSFAHLIMQNTDVTRLPADVFSTPGLILEVDQTRQHNESVMGGADGILGDDPTTLVDESLDDLPANADPAGGSVLTPLVIRTATSVRYTGDEHVVLGGTEGNDRLVSSIGDDSLFGDGGNDRLEGGAGNDVIQGGDGNDIMTDTGGDDLLQGGAGNDVMHGGNGANLLIGGSGNDVIVSGEDLAEIFAGEGDDFILGTTFNEGVNGNEGNDWIETGTQDGAPGDNFDGFGRDTVRGHDIFFGNGGFDEFVGEGGDDIMVGSGGINRNEGFSGFDWVTYKDNTSVLADLLLPAFDESPLPPSQNTAIDRYAEVEGLSGSAGNDTLLGTNEDAATLPLAGAYGSTLSQAGVDRIAGLRSLLGLAAFAGPNAENTTAFDGGDIILGGAGSDLITGRGGNDRIDGDQWLNVRISIRTNPANAASEIATTDRLATIIDELIAGIYTPGQLVAVREIIDSNDNTGVDTVIYSGNFNEYTITNNANGTVTVAHTGGTTLDGVDTLSNIERLQFLDQIVPLSGGQTNSGPPTGAPIISDGTPTEGTELTVSLTNLDDPDGVNLTTADYQWQQLVGGVWENIAGVNASSFTPGQLQVGMSIRVLVDYLDLAGNAESAESDPTSLVGDLFVGTDGPDTYTGTGGADDASGVGASDDLRGGLGDDILRGGDGNDMLRGLAGADTTDGGAGNDTHYVGSALDVVVEGVGQGTADRVLADSSYTLAAGAEVEILAVRLRAGTTEIDLTGNEFANRIIGNNGTNVLDGAGGNDTLLGNGAADIMEGGTGNDSLRGLSGDDILDGGVGNDVFRGEIGNDTILLGANFGTDAAHGFDSDPVDGQDLIDVSGLGITAGTFAANVTITQAGTATVVRIGDDSLRLFNTSAANIDATDFLFA